MHTKSTLVIILVLIVGIAVWYFVATPHMSSPAAATSTALQQQMPQATTTPQVPEAARLQSVTPLPASPMMAAGVDMSAFSKQANQSAAWSAQDGTDDAQSTTANDSSMNSALDDQSSVQ